MHPNLRLSLLFGLMITLTSCGKALPAVQTDPAPPATSVWETQAVSPETPLPSHVPSHVQPLPSATPASTSAPAPCVERPYYRLKAEIDYASRKVAVEETILYTNAADRDMAELLLIAEPNRYPNGFELISLETQGGEYALAYSLDGNQMTVRLDPMLPAGGRIELSVQFELALPPIPPPSDMFKPQPYGYTERQMNLVDWYLFLPPIAETGEWLAHKPSYFGEFLVYPSADYQVEVRLLNAPENVLVAASANNQSDEPGTYLYQLTSARTFALSLNSAYEVAEASMRGVMVRSYFDRSERAAGEEALAATATALELYSDLFGAYPRETLSVVEADFLDGMEFDGLYFLSKAFYNLYDGTPKGYLTIIAVHETAHQWFFGQVGNDQALEPWLDEAWCTFSELLYYERYYPEQVDWWWYYRVDYYEPVGDINLAVYDYPGFTAYRNAVYLRGAEFLYELRTARGNNEFYALTREYLDKYRGKIASTRGLFEIFGLLTGNDQALVAKYFQPSE